jgi:hypothetical protein
MGWELKKKCTAVRPYGWWLPKKVNRIVRPNHLPTAQANLPI